MSAPTAMPLALSASMTCMNPLALGATMAELDAEGLSAYHIDICDGVFAPTFLLYPSLLPWLRQATDRRLDVHLYCVHPSRYIDELIESGAHTIIVQLEAEDSFRALVPLIAARGVRAGLGILPGTPVPDSVAEVIPQLSMIVANTVGPAYAGQRYDPRGLETIQAAARLCETAGASVEIAVDGAVSEQRLAELFRAGANHLVLGTSSVFARGADWRARFRSFRAAAERAFQENGAGLPGGGAGGGVITPRGGAVDLGASGPQNAGTAEGNGEGHQGRR